MYWGNIITRRGPFYGTFANRGPWDLFPINSCVFCFLQFSLVELFPLHVLLKWGSQLRIPLKSPATITHSTLCTKINIFLQSKNIPVLWRRTVLCKGYHTNSGSVNRPSPSPNYTSICSEFLFLLTSLVLFLFFIFLHLLLFFSVFIRQWFWWGAGRESTPPPSLTRTHAYTHFPVIYSGGK